MAVVLKGLVKRHRIRPANPEPERVFRRAITETPATTPRSSWADGPGFIFRASLYRNGREVHEANRELDA
jgi:hypothetical protein